MPTLILDIPKKREKETKRSELILINSFLFCPFFIVPGSNYVPHTLSPTSSPCIKLSQIKSDCSAISLGRLWLSVSGGIFTPLK